MNIERDVLSRLLKSYPVSSLRTYFDLTGLRQDDLVEDVLSSRTRGEILIFAFEQFGYLHQHIYIFDLNTTASSTFNLAGGIVVSDNAVDGKRILNLTFRTEFSYFNPSSLSEEELYFMTPVIVELNGLRAVIKINILERNVNNYFNHKVFPTGRNIEDSDIIGRIRTAMGGSMSFTPTDVTVGVKYLWENNFIDAAYVKFKKSRSTTTESMDEEHTLKDSMPDVYTQITSAPLDKNVFRVLEDVDEFINTFAIEPRNGKIAITRFPNMLNSADRLVQMIIDNN
ncbi:hypothetical protein WNY78_11365 [Psychroserpens sp. AS72]|uniref:hypothetical protein n=1 Tax=Psychroserpens sp. AS72 TaxID=3135775 RepID=UPI00317D475A